MDKFYITTPIYYVNDVPHIGHAYTTIACDVQARFHRLLGKAVFFLTGTDEHGQKVQKSALTRGLSPKAHADRLIENFKSLWTALNISNDAFIRTTDKEHAAVVQTMMQQLKDSGDIVRRQYEGWYCTHDEMFLAKDDLKDNQCPHCHRDVEHIKEDNYFFLMGKYQDRLIEHIESHPDFILPRTRRNEVLGFLKNAELGDLCISRPVQRLSWGIPLPFDQDYVTYVWFDALSNYYSATRYLSPMRYSVEWWPSEHHVIGKDILITHSIYWSTMLFALGWPLPHNIFAHGWWTVDGRKMSKSIGNVVDPLEMIQTYGVDPFRYFLLKEVPFGLDGNFSREALINRINSELANDFGNLANRVIAMVFKYFGGKVPEPVQEETAMKTLAEGILDRMQDALKTFAFHQALDAIWELVSHTNKYIDETAPWRLAKDPQHKERLQTVMYSVIEALRFLAMYLHPFMPESTQKLWEQLGQQSQLAEVNLIDKAKWGKLLPGTLVHKGKPLFPRIDK
jgi:methionyl-tRNA synthetase